MIHKGSGMEVRMGNINIFDLLIGASGVYLIYTALTMKKTGEIKDGVLVSKEMDAGRIKDKDGFINYMFSRVLLAGALIVLSAAGNMAKTGLNGPNWLSTAGDMGFVAALILYMVAYAKAKKMFID